MSNMDFYSYQGTGRTCILYVSCKKAVSLYLTLTITCCNVYGSKVAAVPNQTSLKDRCLSNPCKNGGRCIDGGNSFTCECKSGFAGDLCQKDVGGCTSNPCKNGGSCVQGINKFMCNCQEGFTGDLCETDIDECASNPCPKRTKCLDGSNHFTCVCKKGYRGENCDQDIDECASNPCKHNGKCVDGIGNYWCACKEGYTGNRCEEIDECASDPCENDGTCVDGRNRFKCKCAKGFTGERCETDIDECASNPCQNGGTCHQDIGKYRCICEDGYVGTRCHREVRMKPVNGHQSFNTMHVLIGAVITLAFVYILIKFVRNQASKKTFQPYYEYDEWSSRQEHSERARYRPPPESTAKAEERARREARVDDEGDMFNEQFRNNLRSMFSEIRRLAEKEKLIKERRKEYLKEYEEKEQEIENNKEAVLGIIDIPWPSKNSHADDKSVLFDFWDRTTEEYQRYLRQQKIRWHPDRFLQKFGKHLLESEKVAIVDRVTLLSQEINSMM